MGWTDSRIFEQAMLNPITRAVNAGTAPTSFVSMTATNEVKVALYNNTGTPDRTVAVGLTGYLATSSAWVTANEVIDTGGSNWPAGGIALGTPTWALDTATTSICYHAGNTAGLGNVTIAAAFGCLVYDNVTSGGTVSKQGYCYNYFGGTQGVTAGTFTVIWATVGSTTAIFNITV